MIEVDGLRCCRLLRSSFAGWLCLFISSDSEDGFIVNPGLAVEGHTVIFLPVTAGAAALG